MECLSVLMLDNVRRIDIGYSVNHKNNLYSESIFDDDIFCFAGTN